MKQRILKFCSIIASCFIMLFSLTGCGDRAILNLEIKSGTFEYTYEQGDIVSLDDLVIIVHYNDETSIEVGYDDEGLTVTPFTTETTGKKDVEIEYGGKSITVEVTVKSPSETTLLVRSIATLPDVENITTANRSAIIEMRAKYDALSADGKAKITNYSVLQAAEAKLAALDLAAHKSNAKTDLNGYKNETDYSSAKWALVIAAKGSGIASIDNATTIEAVNAALAAAKTAIDAIDTKVVELAAHKVAVKLEFNSYVQANYSATNWNAVRATIYDAKEAIDAANTIEAVNSALSSAKIALDAIPTLAQEFATYKENKLNALQGMFNIVEGHIVDAQSNRLYDDTNEELILTALNTAVSAITNATTITNIDEAYDAAMVVINGAKLKVVTDVIALIAELTNVTIESKAAVEAARDAYDALSNENKAKVTNYSTLQAAEATISSLQDIALVRTEWKNRLDANFANKQEFMNKYDTDEQEIILDYIAAAKEAIDNATVSGDIIDIYNETVTSINAVKEKVVTDVEDLLDSLNTTITLSHESAIVNVRNEYNKLNGAQRDSISADKYAYLTNAEAEIARLKFEQYKANAIVSLDNKLADCGNDKYNATNYAIIESLINDAKTRINNTSLVTSQEQVDGIVQDVTEAISEIKIKLVTDVEDKISQLVNYAEGSLVTYKEKVELAKTAYNALNDANKGLVANYNDLVSAEAHVKARELAQYKAEKVEELNSYLPDGRVENDYGPTKMATINGLKAEGIANINNAISKDAVDTALSNAKAEVDKVDTQDEDHWTIIGWDTPTNIAAYKDTLALDSSTEGSFKDVSEETSIYRAGDDNPFKIQINIEAEHPTSTVTQTIFEYRSKSIIEVYLEGNWVELRNDLNNPTTYHQRYSEFVEGVNEYTFEFDFTEAAVGKKFRIKLYPYYDTESFEYECIFLVVDGYNVYDEVELGMMYNTTNFEEGFGNKYALEGITDLLPYWKNFLSQKGYTWREGTKGIVLQNNLTITTSDIPSIYLDGNYMKDVASIYEHTLFDANDKFTLHGNFYTIDASKLPIINVNDVVNTDEASHLSLFKTNAFDRSANDLVSCSTADCYKALNSRIANFENFTIRGNANVSETNTDKAMGSMILGKFQMITNKLTNVRITSFLANTMADDKEDWFGKVYLTNVKSYDAFQNALLIWGGSTVEVENSEFKRFGGTAIASTSVKEKGTELNATPNITITNTTIESYVVGNEPWFTTFGPEAGTLITTIQAVDAAIKSSGGKGFYTNIEGVSKTNLIHVGAGTPVLTGSYSGVLKYGEFSVDSENSSGNQSAPSMYDIIQACVSGPYASMTGGNVPLIVIGSNGAMMFAGADGQPLYSNEQSFDGSDYLTIYMQGISLVVEYNK